LPFEPETRCGGQDRRGQGLGHRRSRARRITTALLLDDSVASHHFDIQNNLFVGPSMLAGTRTVDWDGAMFDGRFDHDGFFPDGGFRFNLPPTGSIAYPSFAAMQAGGTFEPPWRGVC
jgi:hypothetical protein